MSWLRTSDGYKPTYRTSITIDTTASAAAAAPLCSTTVAPEEVDGPGIALAVGVAQFVYVRGAP